jgi:hypothetical protein
LTAIVTWEGQVHLLQEGDARGGYVVSAIAPDSVELTDREQGRTTRLVMK